MQSYRLVTGPEEHLSKAAMDTIRKSPEGSVTLYDTLEQFHQQVEKQYANLAPGGFFLGLNLPLPGVQMDLWCLDILFRT